MTTDQIEEKVSQAKSLLMLLGVTDWDDNRENSDDWHWDEHDLLWFWMPFDNYEHMHKVMKMFEPLGLHPHIVPDSEGMEDHLTEETIYLRLAPPDKHYNTPDDVWPEYRYYQQAMREAYGQASSI